MTSLTCRLIRISVGQVSPRQERSSACHRETEFHEVSSWNIESTAILIKAWMTKIF